MAMYHLPSHLSCEVSSISPLNRFFLLDTASLHDYLSAGIKRPFSEVAASIWARRALSRTLTS